MPAPNDDRSGPPQTIEKQAGHNKNITQFEMDVFQDFPEEPFFFFTS